MEKKISKLLLAFTFSAALTGCLHDTTTVDTTENIEGVSMPSVQTADLYAYTLDYDNMINVPIDGSKVEYSGDILTAMNNLATILSDQAFNGLEIDIVNLENVDDKKIVTINLQDGDKGSWYNYFQGSAGGLVTVRSLEETFLQRAYPGEWIDGVQFQYNGEPMPEFDHTVGLESVIYR